MRIPTLDGWRALAIAMVLLSHDQFPSFGSFGTAWLDDREIGVRVFFAISGFLICTLLIDEEARTGSIDLRAFYTRRAFRILPAAVTYLLVVCLLRLVGLIGAVHPIDVLAALFFFRNFLTYGQPEGWYTIHFWTLSVEEHFYLLLPSFLVLVKRFRGKILMLTGTSLLCAGPLAVRLHLIPSSIAFSDFNLGALFLAAGLAVAVYRNKGILSNRILHPATPIAMLVAAFLTVIFIHKPILDFAIPPFLLLAAVSSTVLNPAGLFARILESRALGFIGRRSYSLYLWQQLFLSSRWGPGVQFPLQKAPLNLLCAFTCACLSYSFVEQPFIRMGRRVAERQAQARLSQEITASADS